MRIAVAGGRLQGLEVVYLAKKAGYHTLVIDRCGDVPAAGICDRFIRFEFTRERFVPDDCPEVDLIIPAVEDRDMLGLVEQWARVKQIPLAFDKAAYALSASKRRSNTLFEQLHLPVPGPWPGCGFPVVVKPDQASGSRGVCVYRDAEDLYADFAGGMIPDTLLAQQYLEGPQFSIEVTGTPGQYAPLCVTDLHMDRGHDCKRVTAPSRLSDGQVTRLEEMALTLAAAMDLKGIMDLEVILHNGDLKLLEIDARFPSQTPMAVYWATGINMVQLLAEQFVQAPAACKENVKQGAAFPAYSGQTPGQILPSGRMSNRWVVVEHIQAGPDHIRFLGEHIMGLAGPLRLAPGFFGCREALTSYVPGRSAWVATLIFCADSPAKLAAARKTCYRQIHERIHGFAKTGMTPADALKNDDPAGTASAGCEPSRTKESGP